MNNKLQEILDNKKQEVAIAKDKYPIAEIREKAIDGATKCFYRKLKLMSDAQMAVIAEIKRKSPSAGDIVANDDLEKRLEIYETSGASCISVVTDEKYFGGSNEDFKIARATSQLPLLRKEFIVDEWQVYETKVLGANCMLLIVAALSEAELFKFIQIADELQLDVIVEVHNLDEVKTALKTKNNLIGINNRNLNTFECDLKTTEELAPVLKDEDCLIISESGIKTKDDVIRVKDAGGDIILVGETLMKADDPQKTVGEFTLERI